MLKDFVDLKPGDVVLQNAGNSAVSRYVIQVKILFLFGKINKKLSSDL